MPVSRWAQLPAGNLRYPGCGWPSPIRWSISACCCSKRTRGRLGVSNALLVEIISTMPSLQVDGKFSKARYEAHWPHRGMSPEQFEARLRQDMIMQQLVGAIGDTGIVSSVSAEMMLRIQSEERQVAEIRITPEQFASEVKLEADAAKKFYDGNQKQFETPELVRAEYVVLSLDGLLSQVAVSDAEVKGLVQKPISAAISSGGASCQPHPDHACRRRIRCREGQAKAKAEEVLKDVQRNPTKFAELARQHSQDPVLQPTAATSASSAVA